MEQHPIPQDVTGFQFKLIGSMTVKQFAYVVVGVILAFVIYYLPIKSPLSILIKMILIPLFGGSGVLIAFLPIDGRPVDVMAGNFFKSIFSPNQYVYHKAENHFSFSTIQTRTQRASQQQKATTAPQVRATNQATLKQQQLQTFLQNNYAHTNKKLDEKETSFLEAFGPPPQETISESKKQEETPQTLARKELILTQQLSLAKKEEEKPHTAQETAPIHARVQNIEQQIQKIHEQKEKLEKNLIALKKQLNAQQPTNGTQPQQTQQPQQQKPQIKPFQVLSRIPKNVKQTDLPKPSDTPNVIVGIVKDSRGNVLPNILVEIKDTNTNPVRAFKTNLLGQFASATPLSNGTYSLELEDPQKQHVFDKKQIIADNTIMQPIEIVSHDAREDLRKELFHNG